MFAGQEPTGGAWRPLVELTCMQAVCTWGTGIVFGEQYSPQWKHGMFNWLKTDGQELAGLALLGLGLWWWWPPLCLMVLGGLLLISVLFRHGPEGK